jgi:hypothetical protein
MKYVIFLTLASILGFISDVFETTKKVPVPIEFYDFTDEPILINVSPSSRHITKN